MSSFSFAQLEQSERRKKYNIQFRTFIDFLNLNFPLDIKLNRCFQASFFHYTKTRAKRPLNLTFFFNLKTNEVQNVYRLLIKRSTFKAFFKRIFGSIPKEEKNK